MISIDQNCNSIWDVIPKLHALARKGHRVAQYIEDIDVAFTSMGSPVQAGALHLERERYYRSGGEDWGAAVFYSEFLGKLPVEIRHWEPYTGMKTDVLARHLGRSVDDLYDEFSPGDTWQLIGPSYVQDNRHHRTIGDLATAEIEDFLIQILGIAKENVLATFPQEASVARAKEWFAAQESQLRQWTRDVAARRLVDVYRLWLDHATPEQPQSDGWASQLFPCRDGQQTELLELFTRDYELLAGLYNQAIEDSHTGLRPLKTRDGELPFFGVYSYRDHLVRSSAHLQGRDVIIGDQSFTLTPEKRLPLDAMRSAGILALPGKAILLVLQVRAGPHGRPLAMPFQGSMYMPAAFQLERALRDRGLLTQPVAPIVRVRFHLLDRLRLLRTIIRLPDHLQPYFGRQEIPAEELGNEWTNIQSQARERLERFRDPAYHATWIRHAMPELADEIERLDAQRRELAAADGKAPELRAMWKQVKPLMARQLAATTQQIARDWQAARIDYWDSRGAIWPWCVALGGQEFYERVLREAQVYEERP